MSESRYDEMREACIKFHRANPQVWELFVRFTMDRIRRGFKHYGVDAIFARVRWETDQAAVDPEHAFKMNNNHKPFYARAFMRVYPEYRGFFKLRRQFSKDHEAMDNELGPGDFPYLEQ